MALTRDQVRAQYAYESVQDYFASATAKDRDEYKIAVNGFGANIIRSGLAVTLAFLERSRQDQRRTADREFMSHLAGAGVPYLTEATEETLPGLVRAMPVEHYMVATRELLRLGHWFKRAVQALGGEG